MILRKVLNRYWNYFANRIVCRLWFSVPVSGAEAPLSFVHFIHVSLRDFRLPVAVGLHFGLSLSATVGEYPGCLDFVCMATAIRFFAFEDGF